jgi:hypothetical protein
MSFTETPGPTPPCLIHTVITATALEFKLSDGRTISYPRDPIDIGALKFSYKKADDGKYLYEYTLDNRQVEMIRVGEVRRDFLTPVADRRARGPDGWMGLGTGWCAKSEPCWNVSVSRSETATYTILSNFLPGPSPLHVVGKGGIRDDFKLPFSGATIWERSLMRDIGLGISIYGNSVDRLVMGPAFEPEPTEQEVRKCIRRCVEGYGLKSLRPLDDDNDSLIDHEDSVTPSTDLERQILDCLKVAIRAMIADDRVEWRFNPGDRVVLNFIGQLPDLPQERLVEVDYVGQIDAQSMDLGLGRIQSFAKALVFAVVGCAPELGLPPGVTIILEDGHVQDPRLGPAPLRYGVRPRRPNETNFDVPMLRGSWAKVESGGELVKR